MNLFAIRRKGAWNTPEELQQAAVRSREVGDKQMSDKIRWIRSYVVSEPDGTLGTVCIYQAADAAAIEEHAGIADLQADDILPVVDTVVVREDP